MSLVDHVPFETAEATCRGPQDFSDYEHEAYEAIKLDLRIRIRPRGERKFLVTENGVCLDFFKHTMHGYHHSKLKLQKGSPCTVSAIRNVVSVVCSDVRAVLVSVKMHAGEHPYCEYVVRYL